jgi:hypothetical protein
MKERHMNNSNYATYLTAATQIQRWRDFSAHLAAYLVIDLVFIAIWTMSGRGFFWPAFPLVGWAIGLSFQHFNQAVRGQIRHDHVTAAMNSHDAPTNTNIREPASPRLAATP